MVKPMSIKGKNYTRRAAENTEEEGLDWPVSWERGSDLGEARRLSAAKQRLAAIIKS